MRTTKPVDSEEDASWDAVWDVATRIDSLGWLAEFRLPLGQLRFARHSTHVFGMMITRDIARTNERRAGQSSGHPGPASHRSSPKSAGSPGSRPRAGSR